MMEISGTIYKYLVMVMAVGILIGVTIVYIRDKNHRDQVIDLQNEAAAQATTLQVKEGLYKKATLQIENLQGLLDSKDGDMKKLKEELKKANAQLLDVTQVAVYWKKAYEAEVAGQQHDEPPVKPGDPPRTKVEFEKDFGYIGVNGYTLTNPPMAYVKVAQKRPLKLSVAVTQDDKGKWNTYATSSEENVGVDINLTAVNPFKFSKKWYENIGIVLQAGAGTTDAGAGGLIGIGLNYKIKQFDIGPMAWFTFSNRVDKLFGLTFTWRPFEKN